jgi:hypothetical protein
MIRTVAAITAAVALLTACSGKEDAPPPTAADGDNLSACSDATCEVNVKVGTRIPIATGFDGFTALDVSSIDADGVAYGAKSACCSLNAKKQQPGETTRLNNLDITTVTRTGPTAILRLKPS